MAAMMGALGIKVDKKTFPAVGERGPLPVLRDVDLQIAPGSFVVITGPSGCGKSTLLNIVAGLDHDYEGAIDFGGGAPRLSYMFQTPRLLPWRTVQQNIELVLGDDAEDARKRDNISDMLNNVGLPDVATAYPERLSLGMQRRVSLARAFIVEPDILLMDEPFVSLDDPTAKTLRSILFALWTRRPTTVLFVTHDRNEAVSLATRLIRVDGSPAYVVQDTEVTLSDAQRKDEAAVIAEQKRLFENA